MSDDFTDKLNNYLVNCTIDDDGFCNVPVVVHSGTLGVMELKDLVVAYDYVVNPIYIAGTLIQEYLESYNSTVGFIDVPIKFESLTNGTIQIEDVAIYYYGGNKTHTITARDNDNTTRTRINLTYYYSRWDYDLPQYIDYLEFIPSTPTTKNVTPYGQTAPHPILNITLYNYGGKNANFSMYLNETYSCVNLTASASNSKSAGTQLTNGTFIELFTNKSFLSYDSIYMWADYECNFTTWRLWEPEFYFRACCTDCLCSEKVT